MKKIVSFVLCALFVVAAAGCATQNRATAVPLPELGVTPDHLVPAPIVVEEERTVLKGRKL